MKETLAQKTQRIIRDKITDNSESVLNSEISDAKAIRIRAPRILGKSTIDIVLEPTADGSKERILISDYRNHDDLSMVDNNVYKVDKFFMPESEKPGNRLGPIATIKLLARIAFGNASKPDFITTEWVAPVTMNSAIGFSGGRMPTTVMTGSRGSGHGTRFDPN